MYARRRPGNARAAADRMKLHRHVLGVARAKVLADQPSPTAPAELRERIWTEAARNA